MIEFNEWLKQRCLKLTRDALNNEQGRINNLRNVGRIAGSSYKHLIKSKEPKDCTDIEINNIISTLIDVKKRDGIVNRIYYYLKIFFTVKLRF